MLTALADDLLPGAGEVAQFLNRDRRHVAAADQSMRQQVGQPHRVVLIAFAARHRLDRGRMR